jgi:hypothetical protein
MDSRRGGRRLHDYVSGGSGETGKWQHTLREVFKKVDFIALPTLQTLPPKIPPSLKLDLLKAQAGIPNLQNAAANLAENPAGAILGIPVTGLQLLGIDLLEAQLLNLQNTAAVNFAGNPALAIPIRVHHGSTPVQPAAGRTAFQRGGTFETRAALSNPSTEDLTHRNGWGFHPCSEQGIGVRATLPCESCGNENRSSL